MNYTELKEAVLEYLDNWFWAIEDGTAEQRFPDPEFKGNYTDEKVNDIITQIDEEINTEIQKNSSHWLHKQIDLPAEFSRLPLLQRRALVEGLASLYRKYEKDPPTTNTYDPTDYYYGGMDPWYG